MCIDNDLTSTLPNTSINAADEMGLGKTLSTIALIIGQEDIERERGGPFREEYLNKLRKHVIREIAENILTNAFQTYR